MQVLITDTETTGLSRDDGAVCIEVAAMVYDTKYGPIESYASLIEHGSNAAEHINRIQVGALNLAMPKDNVWARIDAMIADYEIEAFVAHRAEFDQKFFEIVTTIPWICTKVDIDWPGGHRGDHLVHLALAYGLGVASAHRAMTDVDHIARIFTRVAETNDLEALLKRAMRPKKRFVALVAYDQRGLAKSAGFLWSETKREWYREMPPEDAEKLFFRVKESP